MVLRLKYTGQAYKLIDIRTKRLILKAEWVEKLQTVRGKKYKPMTLILKDPDDSWMAECYLKPSKSLFLTFTWNNQYFLKWHDHEYTIYCKSFWQNSWRLDVEDSSFLYKKGFLHLKPQVFKNGEKILQFDDDLVYASRSTSIEAIKAGVVTYLIFNKPWYEVVSGA